MNPIIWVTVIQIVTIFISQLITLRKSHFSVNFNFQVLNIKYLEDKLIKVKSDMTKKLMERRREDVRDQMKELSAIGQQSMMVNYILYYRRDPNSGHLITGDISKLN